jgi:hypothetical protein
LRTGKTRIDNPVLTDDDGPVYDLRRWYEQFFVDVADIEQWWWCAGCTPIHQVWSRSW